MDVKARLRDKAYLLEVFIFTNLAFLALDIYVAHSVNSFGHPAEWIPFYFSLAGPLFLVPALLSGKPAEGFAKGLGILVGVISILVGILGFYLHLESQFFAQQSLRSLVYTAPFVAPLAYTGVGFLLLLNRQVESHSLEWAVWVVILALGGFIGNFMLSVFDHAQNGFFHATEWIPVVSSAFGVSFLLVLVFQPTGPAIQRSSWWVVIVQAFVGLLGFYYHLDANLAGSAELRDRFIFGAPIFAPLLFVNLALLAALGIWALASHRNQ